MRCTWSCAGACALRKTEGDHQVELAELGRGEVVGEIALLTAGERTATVTAVRDSLLAELSAEEFARLVDRRPAVLVSLARIVVQRLAGGNAIASSSWRRRRRARAWARSSRRTPPCPRRPPPPRSSSCATAPLLRAPWIRRVGSARGACAGTTTRAKGTLAPWPASPVC